jgi:hypothetical protein
MRRRDREPGEGGAETTMPQVEVVVECFVRREVGATLRIAPSCRQASRIDPLAAMFSAPVNDCSKRIANRSPVNRRHQPSRAKNPGGPITTQHGATITYGLSQVMGV